MRKNQVLGAFIVVLTFNALAVANASATLWLKVGESLGNAVSAPIHEKIIMVHSGGSLGNAKVECSWLLIGTVGPGAEDKTTLVESLTGEKDLIGNCTTISGFCFGAVIHPINLPWDTRLLLINGVTWDDILNSGYRVLCSFGVQVECSGNVRSKFEGNGANGAKFSFKGPESQERVCSDGGKETLESPAPGEVLGATIS